MKIANIQNFCVNSNKNYSKTNNTSNNNSTLCLNNTINDLPLDKNYNKVFISNPINFKGKPEVNNELAIPLGERIFCALENMNNDDILVVGKNIKTVQSSLKECVSILSNVIKQTYFIKENIPETLLFYKDECGMEDVFNIGKNPIIIKDEDDVFELAQGDSYFVSPEMEIKCGNICVKIPDFIEDDLDPVRFTFLEKFDFQEGSEEAIKDLNLKMIEKLSQTTKTETKTKGRKFTFVDVGGQEDAIREFKEGIIYPMKYPKAYENSIVNRGIILHGPPGTGKTLAAKALATETDAKFIELNGLEMESSLVGESEKNWRKLFEQARNNQPCIIFIDEFDAVAKKRGGHDVYGDKVLNQLLTLVDNLEKNNENVFVIAATNKLQMLDDAIMRSGRFGKHIEMKAPDLNGTEQILNIHIKNKPAEFNVKDFAGKLYAEKATGADISHIVNDAYKKSFKRSGAYEKMEAGTFKDKDIKSIKIIQEDMDNALADFVQQRKGTKIAPIGYNK